LIAEMSSVSIQTSPELASTRRSYGAALIPGLAISVCLALLYWFDPGQHAFYPRCQFYALTGLYCPGCGSLRALHQLFHGHLAAAFHFNALLLLAMPALGWRVFRRLLQKNLNYSAAAFLPPAWLWFGFSAMLIFGVLRNLPFTFLSFLRP